MIKNDLRAAMMKTLKDHQPDLKAIKDQDLLRQITQLPAYQEAQTLASYLAFPFEFDSYALIEQATKDGKTILVPKTYAGGRMIFVAYDAQDLVETSFGLKEPASDLAVAKEEIDLIHVPGLVFNEQGYRIGYGAGYYDRYLADFEGQTVSTIYDYQQADFRPDAYDVAVQEVLVNATL